MPTATTATTRSVFPKCSVKQLRRMLQRIDVFRRGIDGLHAKEREMLQLFQETAEPGEPLCPYVDFSLHRSKEELNAPATEEAISAAYTADRRHYRERIAQLEQAVLAEVRRRVLPDGV